MAESEEELKSFFKSVKESERASLKLAEILTSSPITSRKIEGGKVEVVTDFLLLGSEITADGN